MPNPPDENDEWNPKGKALGADGMLIGDDEPLRPAAPEQIRPPPRPATDKALELAERPSSLPRKRGESFRYYRPEAEARRSRRFRIPGWVWAVPALLVVAGGALIVEPGLRNRLRLRLRGLRLDSAALRVSSPGPAVLHISSTPDGATVRVGETELGITPLLVENLYGGEVAVTITKRGYQTWTGTFRGGEPVTLDAKLVKKTP